MKKLLRSFVYALNGIRMTIADQQNMKIHIATALLVTGAGFYFKITALEWCVVALSVALVLCLEMVNSALENLVDLVTREHHPIAGKVKDIAAGAVLLASITAVVIGVIVFWKYVMMAFG